MHHILYFVMSFMKVFKDTALYSLSDYVFSDLVCLETRHENRSGEKVKDEKQE